MANRARGEVKTVLGDKTVALALTLGALAAVEEAFGADSYEDVFAEVLSGDKVSASKLRRLMLAIVEANGHEELGDKIDALSPQDMAELALDLLKRAFPDPDGKKKAAPKNP